MKPYDIILAGGGAAGLSLACHLARSPLRDRRILMVDQDAKDRDDRTWCFWTDRPTLFDAIVSCSWGQVQVLGKHFAQTLDLQAYCYKMIRGIDFYRFARASLVEHPHIDFLQGRVERIEDGGKVASVVVDGQTYAGTWVFDSLFDWSAFRPDPARYHSLAQQFKGWEIDTEEGAFDPQLATFLDFRTSQEYGLHFFYVLPSSEHNALVESVLCATAPASWHYCEQALHRYIKGVLGIKAYRVIREEQGISPLTDWPFPRQNGKHIMAIGTQGGRVKPSTGYAFLRIQQDSSAIVRSLIEVGHPFHVPRSPRRYRFFDSVMLSMLAGHAERIEPIFTDLFKRNSARRIFRFLDEVASPWQNFLMMPTLPPRLLWQVLWQLAAVRRV
jgi:lycopene beta-cyclase